MPKIYTILLLIPFIFQGCYTANLSYSIRASSVVLSEGIPAMAEDASVRLVLTAKPPEYDEIGIIQVLVIDPMYDDIGKVMEKAKAEARKIGANIIVLKNNQVLLEPEKDSITTTDALGTELTNEIIKIQKHIKYVFSAGIMKE